MRAWGCIALALVNVSWLLLGTAARAELPAQCAVAENFTDPDFALPNTMAAIGKKKLTVLVLGAGSSTLQGAVQKAYPARLQDALRAGLPGVEVTVHSDAKQGRDAGHAVANLVQDLGAYRPALVVWQTGTVEAMKGLDPDEFSATLDKGIETAKAAGADVVLVNAQYSPRTESIIALGVYADHMRWAALRHDVPLFDRYGVMKLWAELGTFDFTAPTNKLDMAEHVHDCLGRLLAGLIMRSATSGGASSGAR
jgi:hypothetical protein